MGDDRQRDEQKQEGIGVIEREEQKPKKPRMYRVLLHNDDFTPMEFVVALVKGLFHKSEEEAVAIMLQVHEKGIGHAGTYTREIAETKVAQVHIIAGRNDHPLMASFEPE